MELLVGHYQDLRLISSVQNFSVSRLFVKQQIGSDLVSGLTIHLEFYSPLLLLAILALPAPSCAQYPKSRTANPVTAKSLFEPLRAVLTAMLQVHCKRLYLSMPKLQTALEGQVHD